MKYIEAIFDSFKSRASYADGPVDVLADLTGEYFCTLDEWKQWWEREGRRKFVGEKSGSGLNSKDRK
jgi:hypothetical protein